jgi:hypothetical protein
MIEYSQTEGGSRTGHTFLLEGSCDLCKAENCDVIFDAELLIVPGHRVWCYSCYSCFKRLGGKLGTGKGQRYERLA